MAKKRILKPEYQEAINYLKYEIARELGIPDYNRMDKGNLPSRANGYVGGNMVKTMVAYAEEAMGNGSATLRLTSDGKDYVQAIDPHLLALVQQGNTQAYLQ